MEKKTLSLLVLTFALSGGALAHEVILHSPVEAASITNTVHEGDSLDLEIGCPAGFDLSELKIERGKASSQTENIRLLAVGVEDFSEDLEVESYGGHDEQAEAFAEFLQQGEFVSEAKSTVLKNCSKKAFREALQAEASQLKAGDSFCFVYSGAGMTLGDWEDEEAVLTNVICLTDAYYAPEEFAQDLALFDPEVSIVCFLGADCSGGLSPNYVGMESESAAVSFAKAARKSLDAIRAKARLAKAGSMDNVSIIASAWGGDGAFQEEGLGDYYLNMVMAMGATPTADLDRNGFMTAYELYYSPAMSLIAMTWGFGCPYIDNEPLAQEFFLYRLDESCQDSFGALSYNQDKGCYVISLSNIVSNLEISPAVLPLGASVALVKNHALIEDLQDDSSEPWMYNKYSYTLQAPCDLEVLPGTYDLSQIMALNGVPIGCSLYKMDKKGLKAQYYIHDEYWFDDGAVKVSLNPKKQLLTLKFKSKAYSMLHTVYAKEFGSQTVAGAVRYAGRVFPVSYVADVKMDFKKMKAKLGK